MKDDKLLQLPYSGKNLIKRKISRLNSLIELSKKLDSEVSVLESRVKSQVVRAVTSTDGEFAAPIADDINDDLNNLNR